MLLFDGPVVILPPNPGVAARKKCQGARFTEFVAARDAWQFFKTRFQAAPELVVTAPARVNLIGEHTDYSGGFVFPVAIDRHLSVAASRSSRFTEPVSAELGDGVPFLTGDLGASSVSGWSKYVAGMAWALSRDRFEPLTNLVAAVQSDIPIGTGVSSSAALEVAFGVVWNDIDELRLSMDTIALAAQRCENEFVGMRCGIMDQMASAVGREGCAMLLDTRSLERRYAPIPETLAIVLCDTNRPHSHTESGYNDRRTQCEAAMAALGVETLRDTSLADLESSREAMGDLLYRRARHIVSENARCLEFAVALERSDSGRLGELMRASHESLRDDYEVSSPELDAMAESAWVAPSCTGARMTGGGFGGACVALVQADVCSEFIDQVGETYRNRTGIEAQFTVCQAVDGAHVSGPDELNSD